MKKNINLCSANLRLAFILCIILSLVFNACQKNHLTPIPEVEYLVTKSTDIGEIGELRQVIQDAEDDSLITFSSNIHPILSEKAINVEARYLIIRGNDNPQTMIGREIVSIEPIFFMKDGAGSNLMLENLNFTYVRREVGDELTLGGGLVSVVNTFDDSGAFMGLVFNSIFYRNIVKLGNALHGGGMIGTNSNTSASFIGNVDAEFSENYVTLTNTEVNEHGKIWGGGLVGAFADNQMQSPKIGNISGTFYRNNVKLASYINGGGLVGAFVSVDPFITNPHTVSIGNVSAEFWFNEVIAHTNLSGGGIIGSWGWQADVEIGDVSGVFNDNRIYASGSYLRGGGIIGLRSYTGKSDLGMISASFLNNYVFAGTFLGGGGIIGLYSGETLLGNRHLDKTSTIRGFDGARFRNNKIEVGLWNGENAYALGGVVAVSGLNEELVVNNTIFHNNTLIVNRSGFANVTSGTFYIGTDRETENPEGHVLTLKASINSPTGFANNKLLINNELSYNSITFGREWDSQSNSIMDSKADAKLNIITLSRGAVILGDPIKIDMNNGKIFTMYIDSDGDFIWHGFNEFYADKSVIHFFSGLAGLRATFQAVGNYDVIIEHDFILRLSFENRDFEKPFFSLPNSFTVNGTPNLVIVGYASDNEYLITDKRGDTDENSFIVSPGYELRVDGEMLYVRRKY